MTDRGSLTTVPTADHSANALVTIAVPTFNRAAYVSESLESIRGQTYPHLEILVGDNASTDGTADLLRELAAAEPRLRVMRHERNLGMVGNFNALLHAAGGEYFVLVSDDDILAPRAVELLVAACRRPGVQLAYGAFAVIGSDGDVRVISRRHGPEVERGPDFIRAHLHGERSVTLAGTMFPIGPPNQREYYDAEIGSVCDLLQRLTLASRGDVASVRDVVAHYRVHDSSLTSSAADFAASHFRVLSNPSVVNGVLSEYRSEVAAYIRNYVAHLALSAAARGNVQAALQTVSVMEAHGVPVALLRAQIRVVSFPPVRLVTAARRSVRAWRAKRRGE
jgi:glycosyltransferase involved in cell wall biosynthesis